MSINDKISKCIFTLLNIRIIREGGALDKSWHLSFYPESCKAAFNSTEVKVGYLFICSKATDMLNELNAASQYVMKASK